LNLEQALLKAISQKRWRRREWEKGGEARHEKEK
jgi:hypothetical protein